MDAPHAFGIVEILGIAASMSLLAGWRLYLVVLATGIAMRTGAVPLPEHLAGLQALANPCVMGVAGVGAFCEFFADKAPGSIACGTRSTRSSVRSAGPC